MINILVTGSKGQVGSEIRQISKNFSQYNFLFVDLSELDITNHKKVRKFILHNNINVIINCAAYTAVDKAESNSVIADSVNHLAVKNLAQISKENDIKLIHISTDYVFDGHNKSPYSEEDIPNPLSVYGKTKYDGELSIKNINPKNSIIIRTSWVYSNYGKNFVNTMLELAEVKDEISVVSDQYGSPTNAADLADVILKIVPKINNEDVEFFHFSNGGVCSWYDFAKTIFKFKKVLTKVRPLNSNEYTTIAVRPLNNAMNKNKIKTSYGIEIVPWEISLNKYLQKINN